MTISASRTDKAFHLLDYSLIIARNETKEGLAHTFSSVETLEISQWFNTYPKCQSVLRLLLEVTFLLCGLGFLLCGNGAKPCGSKATMALKKVLKRR